MERPERGLEPGDDRDAVEQAERAAAEAAAIGGQGGDGAGDEDLDPAMRPVYEGGGGEAEGFEQAEEQLIEAASHGDPAPDPREHEIALDADAVRSGASYGDPDEIEASAVSDPEQFQAQELTEPQDEG